MTSRFLTFAGFALLTLHLVPNAFAFSNQQMRVRRNRQLTVRQPISLNLYSPGRSASRNGKERSKRQYRVGQVVQSELARIIHTGLIKGDHSLLDSELRQRISIVSTDVSPDLRHARISVSIRKSDNPEDSPTVDKRRAYSWLVSNTKPLRHTLAQRMSHMKTSPDLAFVQVDVGAAVDVMYLIEKVSSGYSRESVGQYGGDDDNLPRGYIEDQDFDEEFDEDEWDDEDDAFFGGSGGSIGTA